MPNKKTSSEEQRLRNEEFIAHLGTQTVKDVDLNKEMRKSFLDYSMSVIVSRALPDIRDGLKPVHRRILYTMYENGLYPNVAYRKCADTVGSVLGRYHPHGDASVYDAMVRLAQDFSMRYTLVDGHGNFGSVDGDPPAAYRYTESRMSKIALKMLTDIDKDTVDFVGNYDDRLKEPTVLPSRYPNILVNGSMGIAVGMATNIPPHNMGEVIDGMCALIDDPDIELADLMEYIPGPDFPTAGIIMGRSGIRAAYATGRGKIIVRARTEIVEKKNGRFEIKVSEIPYTVNKARLIESIADLVKDKRIEGISDINDYSSMHGMYISIDLKKDANPQVILNQLFQFTQLQSTFGVINLAIVNGEPKILSLKEILSNYIDFQCQVVTRRTQFDLKKALERAHILEGLKKAIDIVDEIIATIRACKGGTAEAKQAIMDKFGFDDVQAAAIVAFRLGQLAGLEILKITTELDELNAKIEEYNELLADQNLILQTVKKEALEIKEKFGDERRTEIQDVSGEVDIEDLIPEENCVFTLTTMGYLKRQPADVYKSQNRGGRGVIGMTRREEDVAQTMFTASSHDYVMLFTDAGRAYRLKGYEIPESSRNSKGMNVVNILPITSEEKITAMITVPAIDNLGDEKAAEIASGTYLCMITRNGIIKRTRLDAFKNIRKNGVIAVDLRDDDKLAEVLLTNGSSQLLVATRNGMSIRFSETDVRNMGRTACGVHAVRLNPGDTVTGMVIVTPGDKILTVSERGNGRRTSEDKYRLQSRGGKGIINYHTDKNGKVAGIKIAHDDQDVIMISANGVIIRIPADQINLYSRSSKGVRVMRLADDDELVTLSCVDHDEAEVNAEVEELPDDPDNKQEDEPVDEE